MPCWKEQLRLSLTKIRHLDKGPCVVIMGVGSELRGDDAAGIVLVRQLAGEDLGPMLQVIDAGVAPENFCGVLRRRQPDLVIFVDAAQMDAKPGTIRWIEWCDLADCRLSTHALSLRSLAAYLISELGCPVELVGIQPSALDAVNMISPAVEQAISAFRRELMNLSSVEDGAVI